MIYTLKYQLNKYHGNTIKIIIKMVFTYLRHSAHADIYNNDFNDEL